MPLLLAGLSISLIGCSSSDGNSDIVNPFAYPTAVDANEASEGNDTFATATAFSIGEAQLNTNYPQRDTDIFAVELTAGVEYEFSANRLCATCDTEITLFDTDGNNNTSIDNNDDWVGYDSAIQYTAEVSGTYYVQVNALNEVYGVTTYTFSARELIDVDADGWSNYHDCNDNDDTIGPDNEEVAGDGIDQSCTGHDIPVSTDSDIHETDDTLETASSMRMATGTPWEVIFRSNMFSAEGNLRTIDAAGAIDYMKVSVPAMSSIELGIEFDNSSQSENYSSVAVSAFNADGTEVSDSNSVEFLENTTTSPQTYYLMFEADNGTSTGAYVPYYYSSGKDSDGDGFYSLDWAYIRDCNDTDASINPAAPEVAEDDSIDSDCDGLDTTTETPLEM